MHAIVAGQARRPGSPGTGRDRPPVPGPGQLLVKVAAAGVNFIDTYKRSGTYKVGTPSPPAPRPAGTVEAVGDGVTGFAAGDRVATAEGVNCYAELRPGRRGQGAAGPDGVDDYTAAALPLQGITAHYLINSTFKVEPGHTVLLHAGAGGVGLLLTQLLKAKGAHVITTVSTDEKEQLARGAGADHVLRYDGFRRPGPGADRAAPAWTWCTTASGRTPSTAPWRPCASAARWCSSARASGPVPPFDPQRLNAGGSLYLTRPTMGHFLRDAQERRWRSDEIFAAGADGSLKVRIGARYDLAEAAAAHDDLEQRRTTGKVILVP